MMRRIHSAWRIVTDDPPAPAARVHRARIRIRQGDLLVLARHHLSIQCVEALYLLAQLRDLLLEPRGLGLRHRRSLTISGIELREIAGDALIDLFQTPLHFRLGKVPLPRIHSLELAAVNGHARVAEEIEPPAQQNECAADFADRLTVILAEIRNGLEVRHQTAGQPDQLDIALTLPLKPPARLDTIEVARRKFSTGSPDGTLADPLRAAEHPRSRARQDPVPRQRRRSPGPDCPRLHSRQAARETARSDRGRRLPQNASSIPRQITGES